jgi:hypothetical protein
MLSISSKVRERCLNDLLNIVENPDATQQILRSDSSHGHFSEGEMIVGLLVMIRLNFDLLLFQDIIVICASKTRQTRVVYCSILFD